MVKHLSYLLNPKPSTHELDKETLRLTHDHLKDTLKVFDDFKNKQQKCMK